MKIKRSFQATPGLSPYIAAPSTSSTSRPASAIISSSSSVSKICRRLSETRRILATTAPSCFERSRTSPIMPLSFSSK
ncbi:unnamed protein product, partial [Larinioides sclopetarius]